MRTDKTKNCDDIMMWAMATLFALVQFRMIMYVLGPAHYLSSMDVAQAVVGGTPQWLNQQNRILGPDIIETLANLIGDFYIAHMIFTISMTAIAGFMTLSLATRYYGKDAGWSAFFLFQLLFSFSLANDWLYAWDHIDIIGFLLFFHFVVSGKNWRWFSLLFAIMVFNRESAFYMALWMVLDPFVKTFIDRKQHNKETPLNRPMIGAGLACMAVGFGIIKFLRYTLLVKEVGFDPAHPDLTGQAIHIKWGDNLIFMKKAITHFDPSFNFLIPLFLMIVVVMAVLLARNDPRRFLALSVVHITLIVSLFIAALLKETRSLLELVPFVTLSMGAIGGATPAITPDSLKR